MKKTNKKNGYVFGADQKKAVKANFTGVSDFLFGKEDGHFGNGFQAMDLVNHGDVNHIFFGNKRWTGNLFNDLEALSHECAKFMAYGKANGMNDDEAHKAGYYTLARNLVALDIHIENKTEKDAKQIVQYLGQQMVADEKFYTYLKAGIKSFREHLTNTITAEAFKIQYDNVEQVIFVAGEEEKLIDWVHDTINELTK